MKNKPYISVVLANFNGERYLRECIESVLSQTYDSFEFIIVDDGSTDHSAEMIQHAASEHPETIRFIQHQANQGQAAGFNTGIAAAQGQLIAFIDSDDLWYSEKLSITAKDFGDPEVVAFHQHHLDIMNGTELTKNTYRATLTIGDRLREAMKTCQILNFVPTSGLTFSRKVLRQVGPIPVRFRTCADGFLTRTAMCYGKVSATDRSCGAYRTHDANNTFNNPAHNAKQYIRDLLLPELNEFYKQRGIPLEFLKPATARIDLSILRLLPGERILIIRSAPVDRMQEVIQAVLDKFPKVGIDLLSQPGFEEHFRDSRISLLSLPDGMLKPQRLPDELIAEISARTPSVCLIPYKMAPCKYENIHRSLLLSDLKCPIAGISKTALHPITFKEDPEVV